MLLQLLSLLVIINYSSANNYPDNVMDDFLSLEPLEPDTTEIFYEMPEGFNFTATETVYNYHPYVVPPAKPLPPPPVVQPVYVYTNLLSRCNCDCDCECECHHRHKH